jgi:hypothetical protein
MKPLKFPQAEVSLRRPSTMTDAECAPLPVFRDGRTCLSCWKMSWRERFSALFFGRAWLWVHFGDTQPPVSILARRDVFLASPPDRASVSARGERVGLKRVA